MHINSDVHKYTRRYDNYAQVTIHLRAQSRFRSHFRFDSDDHQDRYRHTGRETKEEGYDASPFSSIYARLTTRKVMASLFEKAIISREVGDLTDYEPPGTIFVIFENMWYDENTDSSF